jgi:hypothetical protein
MVVRKEGGCTRLKSCPIAGFGTGGVESTIRDLSILHHIRITVKLLVHQQVVVHLNAEASVTTEDGAQNASL